MGVLRAPNLTIFCWPNLIRKDVFDRGVAKGIYLSGEVDSCSVEENTFFQHHTKQIILLMLKMCFVGVIVKNPDHMQYNIDLEPPMICYRLDLKRSLVLELRPVLESCNMIMLKVLHVRLCPEATINMELKLAHISRQIVIVDQKDQQKIEKLRKHVPPCGRQMLKAGPKSQRKILGIKIQLHAPCTLYKYLYKVIGSLIQQIQLMGRDLHGEDHDKLWRQLEAEIHLHRHKTVVRACRSRVVQPAQLCEGASSVATSNGTKVARPSKQQEHRVVTIDKPPHEGMGMSITGGREHGVPVLISVIHPDTPASRCGQLYVGDAILSVNGQSLKEVSHSEAVDLLSTQEGKITLEAVYISEDDDDNGSLLDERDNFKYKIFDEDVVSLSSSVLMPNGRLSRASVESVRGSTDNILMDSPRRQLVLKEQSSEDEDEAKIVQNCNSVVNGHSINGINENVAEELSEVAEAETEEVNCGPSFEEDSAQLSAESSLSSVSLDEDNECNKLEKEESNVKEHIEHNNENIESTAYSELENQNICTDVPVPSKSLIDNTEDKPMSSAEVIESDTDNVSMDACRTPLEDIEDQLSTQFDIKEIAHSECHVAGAQSDIHEASSQSDIYEAGTQSDCHEPGNLERQQSVPIDYKVFWMDDLAQLKSY
ncbi:unnamed protein product, partial [Meganyctiphanes norvegica]